MAKLWTTILTLALIAISTQGRENKVKMSLYYETLCPDCLMFVKLQLTKTFAYLYKYVDFDMVPYGNANRSKVDGKWQFVCQHGADECYGNKVQACAIKHIQNPISWMGFIICAMGTNPTQRTFLKQCAETFVHVPWDPIDKCSQGDEGDNLLANYGSKTEKLGPDLKGVPTVVFNDHFNQTLNQAAVSNLFKTVCELFIEKPDVCQTDWDMNYDEDALVQQIL